MHPFSPLPILALVLLATTAGSAFCEPASPDRPRPEYSVAELPSFDTDLPVVRGSAINRRGQVIGQAETPDGTDFRAFLFTPGSGILDLHPTGDASAAALLSEAGDVLALYYVRVRPGGVALRQNLYAYRAGVGFDFLGLEDRRPIREAFFAAGMTESGELAGHVQRTAVFRWEPYLYTPGEGWIHLRPLHRRFQMAELVRVVALNEAGEMVFEAEQLDGNQDLEIFVLDRAMRITALDDFGQRTTEAFALNEAGFVVGEYRSGITTAERRAFLYRPGLGMKDLHPQRFRGSSARWLTRRGIVVGLLFRDQTLEPISALGNHPEALFTFDPRDGRRRLLARRQTFQSLLSPEESFYEILVSDVNEHLEVIGKVRFVGEGIEERAFYFTAETGAVALDGLASGDGVDRTVRRAVAINDRGQILIWFESQDRIGTAVLTPKP